MLFTEPRNAPPSPRQDRAHRPGPPRAWRGRALTVLAPTALLIAGSLPLAPTASADDVLAVKQTASPLKVSAGDSVKFTITVSNESDSETVRNVKISDTLVTGMGKWTANGGKITKNKMTATAAQLDPGEEKDVTVTLKTAATAAGKVINTANATSDNGEHSDNMTTTVALAPKLKASGPTVSVAANTALDITGKQLASGGAPLNSNKFIITGQPENGSAQLTGTGIRYTPTQGFQGDDTIDYTVKDGSGHTDEGTVNINVG